MRGVCVRGVCVRGVCDGCVRNVSTVIRVAYTITSCACAIVTHQQWHQLMKDRQ